MSFPSWLTSCELCSSRIFIRLSSFSLCSRSILASLRMSASEESGGTEPELEPAELIPEVPELELEAFRCWYSSWRVAFSVSSSLFGGKSKL